MAFFNLSETQLLGALRDKIDELSKAAPHRPFSMYSRETLEECETACPVCLDKSKAFAIVSEISSRIDRVQVHRDVAFKERDDQRARADSAMRELERLRASVTRFSFPPEATDAIPQRMALVSISDLAGIDTLRDERDKLSEQLVQADKATREARSRQIQLMEENVRLQNRAVSETEKIWRDYNSRPRLFW